jgi:hypothetical protein
MVRKIPPLTMISWLKHFVLGCNCRSGLYLLLLGCKQVVTDALRNAAVLTCGPSTKGARSVSGGSVA